MIVKPLIAIATIAGTLGIATAMTVEAPKTLHVMSEQISYSCASMHFGMKDSDYTALTYDCSTSTTDFSGYYTTHNITASSVSASNCYSGGSYASSNTNYTQYAVRIGKSKGIGFLSITFNKQIVGCTVYALQYASDPVTMKVNDDETTLSHSFASYTKANAEVATYDAYSFTFAATYDLTICSKQASKTVNGKSVSAARFYIADIALRVKAS